jgi:hypothetical protein
MVLVSILFLLSLLAGFKAQAGLISSRPKRLQALTATNSNGNDRVTAKNAISEAKKKVEDVGSSIEDTIGKIKSAPENISSSIDKKVSEVRHSVESFQKFATDTYNAPGYYLSIAQDTAEKAQKRGALIQEKGLRGVFVPLDGSVDDQKDLDPKEKATRDAKNLKKAVVLFFDIAEQVVVAGLKAAQASPKLVEESVKLAKSLPEKTNKVKTDIERLQGDINSFPLQLQAQRAEAKRQTEENRRRVAAVVDELSALRDNVMKWLTLEEPKRITNEVIGKVERTKDGVELLVGDVSADVKMVKDVVTAIPGTLESTRVQMKELPVKVVSAVEEVQADVVSTKDSIVAIPGNIEREIRQKKVSFLSSVNDTKTKVSAVAGKASEVADKVGASARSVASTLSPQQKAAAAAERQKKEVERSTYTSTGNGLRADSAESRGDAGDKAGAPVNFLASLKGAQSSKSETTEEK